MRLLFLLLFSVSLYAGEPVRGITEGKLEPVKPIHQNLVAYYKFNTGITITGAGVSQWNDQSGNGNHLLQGTDADRPALNADGSIRFDQSNTESLKADSFTLEQPTTVYILFKQVTWSATSRVFDGNTTNSSTLFQNTSSPQLFVFAGLTSGANSDLGIDTYGVISTVFNGASGVFQVNNETPVTGNFSNNDMQGFTLGEAGGGGFNGDLEVKEILIYNVAHNASERARMVKRLNYVNAL